MPTKTITNFNLAFTILVSASFCIQTFAQENSSFEARITSVIQIGPNYICFIIDENNNYYKSSAFDKNILRVGELVAIVANEDDLDQVQVNKIDETHDYILAFRINKHQSYDSKITESFFDWPKYREDRNILVFRDYNHLDAVYDYMVMLDSTIQIHDDSDENSIIEHFHDKYPNYFSYYNLFNEVYYKDFQYTESDFQDIKNNWFIYDDIYRSFFSNERLVQIGDKILFYANRDMTVSVDENNTEALNNLIRTTTLDTLRSDTLYVFQRLDLIEGKDDEIEISETRGSFYSHEINACFRSEVKTFARNCFHQKAIKINVKRLYTTCELSGNMQGVGLLNLNHFTNRVLYINWGDGSQTQIVDNYNGQEIMHQYPAISGVNTYSVETKLVFTASGAIIELNDGASTTGQTILFQVDSDECMKFLIDDVTTVSSQNDQYMIQCYHWFYWNGKHGAKTVVFKKNGSVYQNVKAKNRTYVKSIRFKNDCTYLGPKTGNQEKNRKQTSVSKNNLSSRRYKDFAEEYRSYSLHQLQLSGNNYISYLWYYMSCD